MPRNSLTQTETALTKIKQATEAKIWQYNILKEFIDLFSNNDAVLNFITQNYTNLHSPLIDDSTLLTPEELAKYENDIKETLEEKLYKLLNIS